MSDVNAYLLGAAISAFAFFLLVDLVPGALSRSLLNRTERLWLAACAFCLLLLVDGIRTWSGRSSSLGPNRQTPYRWRLLGSRGVFGWGLDTGLPISTVRASPLPVIGLVLAALGFGGPAAGLFYAIGLATGLLWGCSQAAHAAEATAIRSGGLEVLSDRRARIPNATLLLLPTVAAILATVGLQFRPYA